MAFTPIPNVARTYINMTYLGQVMQNRLYIRNNAGWSGEELNTLNNLIITWWNDTLALHLVQEQRCNQSTHVICQAK